MVVRQLAVNDLLESKRNRLVALNKRNAFLSKRAKTLENEANSAVEADELDDVQSKADEIKAEIEEKKQEKLKLEQEIKELEEGLEKSPEGGTRTMGSNYEQRNAGIMSIRESMGIQEVRDFYTSIQSAITEKRDLTGSENTIPVQVIDRIESKIGDYSILINEVSVETLTGRGRAVLAGDIPEAIWTEMTGALQKLTDKFEGVEIDGYSLGGFVPVPNSIIEDSLINLASHVEDRIAKSIAKALDKAILKGKGAASKQPDGIIPAIPTENQVESDGKLANIITHLGLVDTDGTGGEVIAVMNRKTYYAEIMPQTLVETADGHLVSAGVAKPNIAGLRVAFSAHSTDNEIVLGDFKQYLLAQRSAVRIESSKEAKFTEEQTVFKGVGRYDGKTVKPKAFTLVKIVKGA